MAFELSEDMVSMIIGNQWIEQYVFFVQCICPYVDLAAKAVSLQRGCHKRLGVSNMHD